MAEYGAEGLGGRGTEGQEVGRRGGRGQDRGRWMGQQGWGHRGTGIRGCYCLEGSPFHGSIRKLLFGVFLSFVSLLH